MSAETGETTRACTQLGCREWVAVEIVWPGKGWLPYCIEHALACEGVLRTLACWTACRVAPEAQSRFDAFRRHIVRRPARAIDLTEEDDA